MKIMEDHDFRVIFTTIVLEKIFHTFFLTNLFKNENVVKNEMKILILETWIRGQTQTWFFFLVSILLTKV
jgi:hypothetical protein